MIDWRTVFDQAHPEPRATEAAIAAFVRELGSRVSAGEAESARRPNAENWQMPAKRPVPPAYLSFLRYSNGGEFLTGDRYFQMLGTEMRDTMLAYHIPEYMPLAVPFAWNGGSVLYLFDMRKKPDAAGEYPILCIPSSNLGYDDAVRVAGSFLECCRGRFNVDRVLNGGVVLTAHQWDVWTDLKPMLDDCKDERKLRLFACACARTLWDTMSARYRAAVELAEQFADGKATNAKRKRAKEQCESAQRTEGRTQSASAATDCLATDPESAAWNGAWAAATGAFNSKPWRAARARQADLLREIFGNPLRPVPVNPEWLTWNRGTVPRVAQRIYDTQNFAALPVLADAVEDAGCTDAALLEHLRRPTGHVRGCWALDLLRPPPKSKPG